MRSSNGADSIGHGGTSPLIYIWLGTGGGTLSRRTENKKLTKLYWSSRKRSPKRLIVLVQPKTGEGHDKNIFGRCAPTFKFVPVPLCSSTQCVLICAVEKNEICAPIEMLISCEQKLDCSAPNATLIIRRNEKADRLCSYEKKSVKTTSLQHVYNS